MVGAGEARAVAAKGKVDHAIYFTQKWSKCFGFESREILIVAMKRKVHL